MTSRDRLRVAYHGAVTLIIALVTGVLAVTEVIGKPMPSWQAAHGSFLLMGVWMLAAAGVIPSLVLDRASAQALVLSLIATAYAFMTTVLVQTVIGERVTGPGGPPTHWIAFIGNLVVALCGVVSAALVLQGARAALARDPAPRTEAAPLGAASGD